MLRVIAQKNFQGQALVEYGMILLLVAVAVVVSLILLGSGVADLYSRVVSSLP